MLVIRLMRIGKKNQPAFGIVVADKRNPPKSGRFLERVGFWNPLTKEKIFKVERIKYWLSKGAQPSDTVHNLLVAENIIEGGKIPKHKKKKEKKKAPGAEEAKPEKKEEKKEAKPAKPPEKKEAKAEKKEETPKEKTEEKEKEETKKETKPVEEKKEEKPPSEDSPKSEKQKETKEGS